MKKSIIQLRKFGIFTLKKLAMPLYNVEITEGLGRRRFTTIKKEIMNDFFIEQIN